MIVDTTPCNLASVSLHNYLLVIDPYFVIQRKGGKSRLKETEELVSDIFLKLPINLVTTKNLPAETKVRDKQWKPVIAFALWKFVKETFCPCNPPV